MFVIYFKIFQRKGHSKILKMLNLGKGYMDFPVPVFCVRILPWVVVKRTKEKWKRNTVISVIQRESHLKVLIPHLQKHWITLFQVSSVLPFLPNSTSRETQDHVASLLSIFPGAFIIHLNNWKKVLHSTVYKASQYLPLSHFADNSLI